MKPLLQRGDLFVSTTRVLPKGLLRLNEDLPELRLRKGDVLTLKPEAATLARVCGIDRAPGIHRPKGGKRRGLA